QQQLLLQQQQLCAAYPVQSLTLQQQAPQGPCELLLQPKQQQLLLQQLEHERLVLRQQVLRGASPQLLLQTLGRQDAIQRELAFVIEAEQQQQQQQQQYEYWERQQRLSSSSSSSKRSSSRPGFLRSLLSSYVFKFLLLLWLVYGCVVGCMYTLKHKLLEQQWGWATEGF
ncbi:hypothetical protein ETH_00036970, partial [Eimeria tenella]